MRTQGAETAGRRSMADDIATIHVRKPGAAHTIEPVVNPAVK
jgi:hypothetical protein